MVSPGVAHLFWGSTFLAETLGSSFLDVAVKT
jgi:hypothetical protein